MNFFDRKNVLSFAALATSVVIGFVLPIYERDDRPSLVVLQDERVAMVYEGLKGDGFAPSIFFYSFEQGKHSNTSESFAALRGSGGWRLPDGVAREFCLGALSRGAAMDELRALGLDRVAREAARRLESPITDARVRFAKISRNHPAAAEFGAFGNFVVNVDGFTLPKELPHEIKVSYYRNLKQLAPADFRSAFEKLIAKGDGKAAEMAIITGGLQSVLARLTDRNADNMSAGADSFMAKCVDEIWLLDTQAIPAVIAGMEKLHVGHKTRLALIRAMLVSGNDFTPLLEGEPKSKWESIINEARRENFRVAYLYGLSGGADDICARVAIQYPKVFTDYAASFRRLMHRDIDAAARCFQSANPEVKAELTKEALTSDFSPESLAEVENRARLFPPESRTPILLKLLKELAFRHYSDAKVGLDQSSFSEAEKNDLRLAMAGSFDEVPQADREGIITELIQKGVTPEKAIQMACEKRFERGPASAVEYVQSLPDGKPQLSALQAVVKLWCESDPPAASEWIATLPNGAKRDIAVSALVTASVYDKERAYENLNAITDRVMRIETGKKLIQQMVLISPSTVKADLVASGLPAADQMEILSEIAAPLIATPR